MDHDGKVQASFFQAAPGISLYFETTGNCESGRRIVFLHGFGASTEDWSDVRPQLERVYCMTSLDLKGHGRSSRPRDGNYSLDEQADLLLAFLAGHCPKDTVLVGHSYGGAVALVALVKALQRGRSVPVSALVLVDVPAYPQHVPFFLSVLYTPVLKSMASLLPSELLAKIALKHAFYDHRKLTPPIIKRYATVMDIPGSRYALGFAAKQMMPNDLTGYLRGLRVLNLPTLIIWGEKDTIVPAATARRLSGDIRSSELKLIPLCGHVPQEEQPEKFTRLLREFLATLRCSTRVQRHRSS